MATEQMEKDETVKIARSVEPVGPASADLTCAFLLLRGWLAVRAIMAGIDKFGAYKTIQKPFVDPTTGMEDPSGAMVEIKQKFYALTNYSGVPAYLKDKSATE